MDITKPHLVEVAWHHPRTRNQWIQLRWCGDDLDEYYMEALASHGEVRVRAGYDSGDRWFPLSPSELNTLLRFWPTWLRNRNTWAGFESHGYQGSVHHNFHPPGRDAEPTLLRNGLKGKEARKPVHQPNDGKFPVTAEIWWLGESVGSPDGELIGKVYQLTESLNVAAYRFNLILTRKGSRLFLDPSDNEFIRALVSFLKKSTSRRRRRIR